MDKGVNVAGKAPGTIPPYYIQDEKHKISGKNKEKQLDSEIQAILNGATSNYTKIHDLEEIRSKTTNSKQIDGINKELAELKLDPHSTKDIDKQKDMVENKDKNDLNKTINFKS